MIAKFLTLAAAIGAVSAQRPANTSICDYYTTALLKNNTAANQLTLLTLLVNTAVIGNYTPELNQNITVPGILNPNGTYNGTDVNLVPYFNGGLASTNSGGSPGSVNFLDGGGAAPLMQNMAANSNSTNQYRLLTHLYQFFGVLLGCSQQSDSGAFAKYQGKASMYEVHKYMGLDLNQMGYFIEQVALSAKSFGVADADITAAGTALNTLFNNRCGAAVSIGTGYDNATQSICTDPDTCPIAAGGNCDSQPAFGIPAVANSSLAMGEGNTSASFTPASTSSGAMPTGSSGTGGNGGGGSGAEKIVVSGLGLLLGGAVALVL